MLFMFFWEWPSICMYLPVIVCVCVRDSFVEWGELGGGVMK